MCEDLIDALNEGEAWWDDEMDNPVRPGETLTVGEIVSGLHLEPWLRFGEEE